MATGSAGSGNEDYILAWWQDDAGGSWNDANFASGYLVEYGASPAAVPIGGGLPLIVTEIGLLGAMRTAQKITEDRNGIGLNATGRSMTSPPFSLTRRWVSSS